MKSYIQGILTGGFIVFTLMVILGHKDYDSRYSQEIGRYSYNFNSTKDTEDLIEIL